MPIYDILANYGYENRNGKMWWGIGSLVWGYIVEVSHNYESGEYHIRYRAWEYNCAGDCVCDEADDIDLKPYEVLTYLVPRLPMYYWQYRRHN